MDYGSITMMLAELRDGVEGAKDRLFARVYEELQAMAAARLRREGRDRARTDENAALDLVHDAHLRLTGEDFVNRRHLFHAYTRAMRQIRVEHARRRYAVLLEERGSWPDGSGDGRRHVEDEVARLIETIHVHELLDQLVAHSPREHEVVILRYFGDLSDEDIAEIIGVDARTVRRDWASARKRLAK